MAGRTDLRHHHRWTAMGTIMLDDRLFLALAFRFGSRSRRQLRGRGELVTGPLNSLGSVIWFLIAGW